MYRAHLELSNDVPIDLLSCNLQRMKSYGRSGLDARINLARAPKNVIKVFCSFLPFARSPQTDHSQQIHEVKVYKFK